MPQATQEMADPAAGTLETARTLVRELHPGAVAELHLDSSLDRDLQLDSLARVELLLRLEQAFGVSLPEETLATAETLSDLVRAVSSAGGPSGAPAAVRSSAATVEAAVGRPDQAQTLIEVLDWHVRGQPERVHVLLQADGDREEAITYAHLRRGAERVAAGLVLRGLQPAQTVAIMLPTGRAYLESFLGVLIAGGVPVPIYPPARLSQVEDHIRRHAGILSNAQAVFLITVREAKALSLLLRARVESLRDVLTPVELAAEAAPVPPVAHKTDDIAFLQYTSGSTGNPKGVILSHRNMLGNIRAMGEAGQLRGEDVYVSWLPLYHDMGLIASWLTCLYFGARFVLMSPLAFLARPQRWLWALHHHRGTLSGAPNFAYELCLRRVLDADLEGLDLSSWRIAYNGSEPASPETMAGFVERFARYGFRASAMTPAFGLAECTVCLTCTPPGRGPLVDRIRRAPFMATGEALPADPADERALCFVSCGLPLPGHRMRIVEEPGGELGERRQGHLEFQGPSATRGYFRNPEQTRRLLHDGWLDTGDLAYVADGELYITGRAKDLIIRGGRHFHPYELEEAVGAIPGIRRGCVAVFGSADPRIGTERLIVVAESRATEPGVIERLRREINDRCLDVLGTPADDVVVAPPHTVFKTSSGKIRRAASRELYERRGAAVRRAPAWWQFVRLVSASIVPELGRVRRGLAARLYAGYWWSLFTLAALATWLAVALLPDITWRWAAVRTAARWFLSLCGIPFSHSGLRHVPVGGAYVAVANHASYLDGLFLIAAWPEPLCFAAKAEFRRQFVAGTFLRRLGAEFVERFDFRQGVEDTRRLAAAVRGGHRLMFFPEGTFTRAPGLAPFHLGAFVVAAQTGVPIVPVSLRGTRSVLRDGSAFPRRRPVALVVGAPLAPQGSGWKAALRLRDEARAELLRHCGEPDLAA